MKGRIYSQQKCHCGMVMVHDERRSGVFCPVHKDSAATRLFVVQFGRDIRRRFASYEKAERFLTGLRFKVDEDSYDPRDYQADTPLSFQKLALEYLQQKRKHKSFNNIQNYIKLACEAWGDRSVKTIGTPVIRRFLNELQVSDKTRANYRSTLNNLFNYLVEEEVLRQAPKIPRISFELGWRKVTSIERQQQIMDELHRVSWGVNPKIWLAIDLLRTYTSLRPGDLLKLTEGDIRDGVITVLQPTKKRNQKKTVRILDEHQEMIAEVRSRFPALPNVLFFRHHGGIKGSHAGQGWGRRYLYKWWMTACGNLGVKGLDLYGGTRHTTITELAKVVGEAGAREASGHETNRAFERYCQMQGERALEMAKVVRKIAKMTR